MVAKKKYTKKTPEQRQAETKELRERQEAAILNLVESDQWSHYLDTMRHFRNYSVNNMLLILLQLPEATRVAGFKVWQTLNRKVTSGPGSGLKIWGKPYRPKIWVPKGTEGTAHVYEEKDGEVKIDASFTRCPIVHVFDISQTEGDPLPEIATPLTDGDDTSHHEQIIETLTAWLSKEGWDVEREPMGLSTKGYTDHTLKRIALNESNSVAQNVKTLIHEAAHAVLHGDDTFAPVSKYGTSNVHRGAAEVQAESVAYVVAGMLGLDTSGYSTGYVAGWATAAAQSQEREKLVAVLQQSATAVKKGVDTIMDGLEINSVVTEAESVLTEAGAARAA